MVGTTPQRPRTRAGLIGALVVAVGLLGACSCSSEGPSASPTTVATSGTSPTTAGTTSTTTPNLLEDPDVLRMDKVWEPEVMDALRTYARAQQVVLIAGLAPVNPDLPDLALLLTGEALRANQDLLREDLANQRASRPPTVFIVRPETVEAVAPGDLTIVSCLTSNAPYYEVPTGSVLGDATFSSRTKNRMVTIDGSWRLAEETELGSWDGETCLD